MFPQQYDGGYNYPNQFQGGYYNANGDYLSKGYQPTDRYYTYGQPQQTGYNYGNGMRSDECMDQCLACLAATCCCCLLCNMLH